MTPDDLIAYLDGEAPGPVAAHLRACPSCAATVRAYARQQRQLQDGLDPGGCPSSQTLGEYELEVLGAEARVRIAAHVQRCPHCTDELRTLRDFLAWEPPAPEPGLVERGRQRLALVLAPPPQTAMAGLRGAEAADNRTYQAADITVSLSLAFDRRRRASDLLGLIWRESAGPETLAGRTVTLTAAEGASQTTAIDELGNFAFESVAPGTYRLEVALDAQLLAIAELVIGGADPGNT